MGHPPQNTIAAPYWPRAETGPARHLASPVVRGGHRRDAPGRDRRSSTHTVASVRATANEASAMRLTLVPPWKVTRYADMAGSVAVYRSRSRSRPNASNACRLDRPKLIRRPAIAILSTG